MRAGDCTDVETEAQRGGVTHCRPGTSKAGAESDLRTREDRAGSTREAQTEGAEMERVLYLRGSTRAPHGAELHQSRDAGPQAVSAERSRDGLWGQPTTYHRNRDPFSRGRAEVSGDIHPSSLSLGKVALRLSVSSAPSRFLCTTPPPHPYSKAGNSPP